MQPLYTLDRNELPHIDAVEYPLKGDKPKILEVPERNAVGTNSYHNAVTVLELSGSKVREREIRRNFKKYVTAGDTVYLPRFSSDTIGYTQTRSFLLFNLKTGDFKDQLIVRRLELTISDVAVLDWEKRLFLFNVDFIRDLRNRDARLFVMDLSGPEPKEVANLTIANEPFWAELGKTTFYFTREAGKLRLHAVDERLHPIHHPLEAVYNAGGGFTRATLPCVHPVHPIGVFWVEASSDGGEGALFAASWGRQDVPAQLFQLAGRNFATNLRFSPDGKWLLFLDTTEDPLRLMVMPVNPDKPPFFGPPILLRTSETIPEDWNGNCAWISDPLSVVCTTQRTEYIKTSDEIRDVNKLLKWELSPANVKK